MPRPSSRKPTARTFRNPILPGFHPDPSICRVGANFYLVNSSFEYFPGVPIFRSRDLVHWEPLGHVLTRKSQLNLDGIASCAGIYAPTLRHHNGHFYLITTLIGGGGNFLVTACRPEGPWSDPIWLDEDGIDPSLLFHKRRVYYTRTGKGTDFDHPFIYQGELDPVTLRRRGRMRIIWRGTGGVWPEGPHLHFLRGRYYLLAAEGGTFEDHAEMAARAATPFGPFEACPRNPILSHRKRSGHPIQATGHVDLVTLEDGSTWAVFLGVRPQGGFVHLGRETFLAPVHFDHQDWPVVGMDGQVEEKMLVPPLSAHPFAPVPAREDFKDPSLGPAWCFLRNSAPGAVSLAERLGYLRLWGGPETLDDIGATTFVGRRQEHFHISCQAELDFSPQRSGEEAGLTARAHERFHLDIAVRRGRRGREAVAIRRTGGSARVVGRADLGEGAVRLEIAASASAYELRAGRGSQLQTLATVPARALSGANMGKHGVLQFTGIVLGMYATGRGARASAPADFDWFAYRER